MGASGSGKTTLLDVLSDRISSRNLTGEISLNGAPVKGDTIRRLSAYVMQDDLMFPALTVRETLMYAAELRLPPTVSRVEKAEKVRRLIRLLGLTKVENSKIGDENNRGISGGERKRVAIGVEMIGDPKILFLDEPTSGLDSTSAFRVVKVIKRIAVRTGSIVVMVLHQPSFRLLGLLDRLLLLGAGRMLFFGQPAQLPEFLSAFGCPPPPFANPTEFALDVIQRLGHETEGGAKRGDDVDGEDDDEEEYDMDGGSPGGTSGASPDARVAETYSGGGGAASAQMGFLGEHQSAGAAQLQPLGERNCAGEGAQTEHCGERKYANGWWRELRVLMSRSVRVIARTPALYLLRLLLIMVTGLLIASLFWRPPFNAEGLHERLAFISFLVCTLFFSSADATPLFIQVCHSAWNGVQSNTTLSPTYMLAWAPYMVYSPLHVLMALAITAKSWWHIFSPGSTLSQSIFHPFPPLRIPGLHTVFLLFDPNHLQERNIFIRETSQHAYRPSTYMVASTLVYLPLHVLMALAITAESWWCVNLSGGGTSFFFVVLVCFCCLFTGNAYATFVSAAVNNVILACAIVSSTMANLPSVNVPLLSSLPTLPLFSVILAYAIVISTMANFALVCGFYIQRQSIPPFWIWLHYLSPVKYAYEAVTLNEFAAAGPSTCYQPAGDLFAATPLSVLLSPAQVNQSLAVLRPALARTPFTDLSVSTCLQTGPELLVYSLGLTQMSKWECVAVLVGIGSEIWGGNPQVEVHWHLMMEVLAVFYDDHMHCKQ
ncbi:unnamed protein product [Closterium sp. NIES-64]|nr:unnamed protein product [Closterium sp. NIES-64]